MSITWRYAIVCECGQSGHVVIEAEDRESDRYFLEGFEGKSFIGTATKDKAADVLGALAPRCLACGQTDKVQRW